MIDVEGYIKPLIENVPVTLKVIKPLLLDEKIFNEYTIQGDSGDRIRVPLSIAKVLVREGYCAFDDDTDINKMKRVLWFEMKDKDSITELPKDFYLKIGRLIKRYEKKLEKDPLNYEANFALNMLKSLLHDIIKCRLQKIVKLCVSNPNVDKDVLNKLTVEEEFFYKFLCGFVNSWLNYIENECGEYYDE